MQRSIHQRLDALSCTDLSDAMDRLKILCQCTDIKPLDRSFSLTGKAWTLRYGPVGLEGGSVGDGHRRRCPIAASARRLRVPRLANPAWLTTLIEPTA